jgi:hypothetical protein
MMAVATIIYPTAIFNERPFEFESRYYNAWGELGEQNECSPPSLQVLLLDQQSPAGKSPDAATIPLVE